MPELSAHANARPVPISCHRTIHAALTNRRSTHGLLCIGCSPDRPSRLASQPSPLGVTRIVRYGPPRGPPREPPRTPQSVATHLGHDAALAPLLTKAHRLTQLQKVLTSIVPAEIARDCRIANIRHDHAVIWARTNATAAKLKLFSQHLATGFALVAKDVKGVKVEVQFAAIYGTPPDGRSGTGAKNVLTPPAAALEALALKLPDSRLRRAVESLAAKGKR